jgi:hypothetical protein
MFKLKGIISDRIRKGEIPKDALNPGRQQPEPSAKAIKRAKGQGLGKGATGARNGGN